MLGPMHLGALGLLHQYLYQWGKETGTWGSEGCVTWSPHPHFLVQVLCTPHSRTLVHGVLSLLPEPMQSSLLLFFFLSSNQWMSLHLGKGQEAAVGKRGGGIWTCIGAAQNMGGLGPPSPTIPYPYAGLQELRIQNSNMAFWVVLKICLSRLEDRMFYLRALSSLLASCVTSKYLAMWSPFTFSPHILQISGTGSYEEHAGQDSINMSDHRIIITITVICHHYFCLLPLRAMWPILWTSWRTSAHSLRSSRCWLYFPQEGRKLHLRFSWWSI